MIERTRRWVMRDLRSGQAAMAAIFARRWPRSCERFGESQIEQWSTETWEASQLHALWRVCHRGVHGVPRFCRPAAATHSPSRLAAEQRASILTAWSIPSSSAFVRRSRPGRRQLAAAGSRTGLFASVHGALQGQRQVEELAAPLPGELRRIDDWPPERIDVLEGRCTGSASARPKRRLHHADAAPCFGWAGRSWQMRRTPTGPSIRRGRGIVTGYLAVRLVARAGGERIRRPHLALGDGDDWRICGSRLATAKIPHAPAAFAIEPQRNLSCAFSSRRFSAGIRATRNEAFQE